MNRLTEVILVVERFRLPQKRWGLWFSCNICKEAFKMFYKIWKHFDYFWSTSKLCMSLDIVQTPPLMFVVAVINFLLIVLVSQSEVMHFWALVSQSQIRAWFLPFPLHISDKIRSYPFCEHLVQEQRQRYQPKHSEKKAVDTSLKHMTTSTASIHAPEYSVYLPSARSVTPPPVIFPSNTKEE